jgi:hypothetical protein
VDVRPDDPLAPKPPDRKLLANVGSFSLPLQVTSTPLRVVPVLNTAKSLPLNVAMPLSATRTPILPKITMRLLPSAQGRGVTPLVSNRGATGKGTHISMHVLSRRVEKNAERTESLTHKLLTAGLVGRTRYGTLEGIALTSADASIGGPDDTMSGSVARFPFSVVKATPKFGGLRRSLLGDEDEERA